MKHLVFALLLVATKWAAQSEKTFDNGHGGKITLPFGDISFADSVVHYKAGIPTPAPQYIFPEDAVGGPDFNESRIKGFVSLGTGGELVLAFKDNALVNIPGIDLYVFEVGRHIEETILFVSKDLKKWIKVGRIKGGNASVDLGDSIQSTEMFRYVKLVDARTAAHSGDRMWPGADIDAVAAVGSAGQISLDALYLFEVNKSVLKADAKKGLDSVALILNRYKDHRIIVEGHTDSTGAKETNRKLSLDRAQAVKSYLLKKLSPGFHIDVKGLADDHPAASNNTPEGRRMNRRVEVYFLPHPPKAKSQ